MTTESRRLLIAIDAEIREINRATINPMFTQLKLSDLTAVIKMAAKARGRYLRLLYDMAHAAPDNIPSAAAIEELTAARQIYEELVKGSQALETAIDREYLDVSK